MKLTLHEIDNMPAGKEMERLIGEEIMKRRPIPEEIIPWLRAAWVQLTGPHNTDAQSFETMAVIPKDDGTWYYGQHSWVSTDDRAALEMLGRFWEWEIKRDRGDYIVEITPQNAGPAAKRGRMCVGCAETLALAACRAALKAKLAEEGAES